jgi:potassium-transporting ATPase A subunit
MTVAEGILLAICVAVFIYLGVAMFLPELDPRTMIRNPVMFVVEIGVDPQSRLPRPDRGHLRLRLGGAEQRLGLRRAGGEHAVVRRDARPDHTDRPGSRRSCWRWPSPVPACTRAPGPTLDTAGPTFVAFLLGVIVIVGGLIYLPMLILGPVGERIVG